ncbi:MAG: Maf family protein [Ignavibacteria bacterium]|nr:Maf family protein [Ignavibacteria bacterium]
MHNRLILASISPRRLRLLNQIGLYPEVIPSSIDEAFDPSLSPLENARVLSRAKADSVASVHRDSVVIGADTVVVLDDQLLGKPTSPDDAIRMLRLLSGRTHTVITAFSLVRAGEEGVCEAEETDVTFRTLPDGEIRRYVAGGSPMDKAGAYGIQDDYGAVFVSRIEGCYYNVVGLPLSRFWSAYRKLPEYLNEVERNPQ